MQKWRGKAWSILSREWCQCLPRYTEGGRGLWSKDGAWAFSGFSVGCGPDDDWSIQSKCQQVIFRTQVVNRWPLSLLMEHEVLSCCPKRWSFEHSRSKKHTAPRSKQRTCAWNAFLQSEPTPPLCLLRLDTDVIHMIKRPSPTVLHTASDIKNWTVGRPGNEANGLLRAW